MNIYLVGLISDVKIEECITWRKQIREHYANWKGQGQMYGDLCFLDPLNGENYSKITNNGLEGVIPPNAIVHKDYSCVRKSDLIIINTDLFGTTRPLIGSIFELAWAYERRIPVIMINNDPIFDQHPFVTNTVSIYVKSVEELLEKKYINIFYKAFHTAEY